jgi:hypothetical protein
VQLIEDPSLSMIVLDTTERELVVSAPLLIPESTTHAPVATAPPTALAHVPETTPAPTATRDPGPKICESSQSQFDMRRESAGGSVLGDTPSAMVQSVRSSAASDRNIGSAGADLRAPDITMLVISAYMQNASSIATVVGNGAADASAPPPPPSTRVLVISPGCSVPASALAPDCDLTVVEFPADAQFPDDGVPWGNLIDSSMGQLAMSREAAESSSPSVTPSSSRESSPSAAFIDDLQRPGVSTIVLPTERVKPCLPQFPQLEPPETAARTAAIVAGTPSRIVAGVSARVLCA